MGGDFFIDLEGLRFDGTIRQHNFDVETFRALQRNAGRKNIYIGNFGYPQGLFYNDVDGYLQAYQTRVWVKDNYIDISVYMVGDAKIDIDRYLGRIVFSARLRENGECKCGMSVTNITEDEV